MQLNKLGAYISSTTLIQNDELVSDRISSIGDGEILEYDLLESTKLSESEFFVVIDVKVSKSQAASFYNRNSESAIEFQGDLFLNNIEIIDLNMLSEINSIKNLLEVSEKYVENLIKTMKLIKKDYLKLKVMIYLKSITQSRAELI